MTLESVEDSFQLLHSFLSQDFHYLESSKIYGNGGGLALQSALKLFLEKPELGFVWLAYDENNPKGICWICFAISTSIGGIVAKLEDVFIKEGCQGKGIGSSMIEQLKVELKKYGVRRIDTAVHLKNKDARRFYEKHGFCSLNEERLACLL